MLHTRHTLIQRLQNQYDDEAWETFVESYGRYIYTVIRRMQVDHEDCMDLQQDILLKLWKKLPDFRYEPDKAKFRSWLCTVIRNTVVKYINSTNSRRARDEKSWKLTTENGEGSEELDTLMQAEWQTYVTNLAMERIREKFSAQSIEVFSLTLEGKSVETIAAKFELKENSIYRINNRVKARLIAEAEELRRNLE